MISIIMPIYNEEAILEKTLRIIARQLNGNELIVVDGGSSDNSLSIARRYANRVIISSKGRASQMNSGARLANGNVLLFLHADSWLEDGALDEIEGCFLRDNCIGGCLTQRVSGNSLLFRLIEIAANIRARYLHRFYGDQAIFLLKDIFIRLGGFPDINLFEDLAFSTKMHRSGRTILLKKRIYCSSRRWDEGGIIKTTLKNWLLTMLYLSGVATAKLHLLYGDVR